MSLPKDAYDVVVIGAGPGGSHAAACLALKGFKTVVIEKEAFPRFRIGESLLPASMPLLKETGFYPKLAAGEFIEKYGARFVDYETDEEIYFGFSGGVNEEIPMAFEVPRAKFDAALLEHAKSCGAEVRQPCVVEDVEMDGTGLTLRTSQGELRAKFLVDASGRAAIVGKKLGYKKIGGDFNNLGVFAHFKNVERAPGKNEGDIRIGLLRDKSWTWQIPFKGEITSVGVVSRAKEIPKGVALKDFIIDSVCGTPKMRQYMQHAEIISEPAFVSNYGQECEEFWGARWLLVGDAAKFLDPCFSSGVHNSIQSAKLASDAIEQAFKDGVDFRDADRGKRYEAEFRKGLGRFHKLISLFYSGNFVQDMKRTLQRKELEKAFTSAVAGDMWNDSNFLFQKNVL